LRFSVSIPSLDPNQMPFATIYAPTNGSVNVATNPAFYWSVPTNSGGVNVVASTPVLLNYGAFFPVTATNWPSPPTLHYGTNGFTVNYTTLPTATFSIPVDIITLQPLSNWVASAAVYSSAGSTFIVGAPGPAAVQLFPLQQTAGILCHAGGASAYGAGAN
jgi:hypothetical protein